MRFARFGVIAACLLAFAPSAAAARLAIVIDDLGYNFERGRRVVLLPAPVSLSILPFTPAAGAIARLARRYDRDVLLHQPLESERGTWADGLLTTGMTAQAIEAGLETALASVPFAIGINNHAGSRFTRDIRAMGALMRVIRQADRRLLFLDSRTTADTVAESAARYQRVPFVARDVFLDHVPTPEAMAAAFEAALRKAKTRGYAVAIAHPKPATLAFLEARLVDVEGVDIVPISRLLPPRDRAAPGRLQSRASPHRAPSR